ncbi:MAG: nucleotidyltransferase domain-containing protein [Egibacteraceae bacterium]
MVTAAEVVERRRRARARLVATAREFAGQLDAALSIRAVVIFGSVARGDFNDTSDIDVLVVAEQLPARATDRLAALGAYPSIVEPVVWTPHEWAARRHRGDPIVAEALDAGIWLAGDPSHI